MSAAGKDYARVDPVALPRDSGRNSCEREWVSLGEGFSLEIVCEAPDLINVIWHPRMPAANEMPLVIDAYLRARGEYFARLAARTGKKVYEVALLDLRQDGLWNRAQRRAAAARARGEK